MRCEEKIEQMETEVTKGVFEPRMNTDFEDLEMEIFAREQEVDGS